MSPAGYWIGGAILLVGSLVAVVWFALAVLDLVDAPEDFDRIAVPGSTVLTLDDGTWMIYQEYPGADEGLYRRTPPSVAVIDPEGRPVSLRPVSSSFTYSIGGHDGVALHEFTARRAGAYTIDVEVVGEPASFGSQTVAVGRPLFDIGDLGSVLGSLALGAASFVVGMVVLIVTIVRRGRGRPRVQPVGPPPGYGGYGYAPYGGPPAGPPPYGGPPGGPPSGPPPTPPGAG